MKNKRANLVLVLIILFGAIIIGRLIHIQILNHDFYQALALGQQRLFEEIKPDRGNIFIQDKDGNSYILATNKTSAFVFISPSQIEREEEISEKLAETLSLEKEEVFEKINQEEEFFAIIKKHLTEEETNKIQEEEIPGVFIAEENLRIYPEKELGSNFLGFVGGENTGQYGLEGFYEKELRGEVGLIAGERSSQGNLVFLDSQKFLPAQEGSDLVLTIDLYVQLEAERLLRQAKENLNVEGGQILVLNPNTGKVIAAASLVNYDPNNYSDYDLSIFKNSLVQKIFEPGSVFKPITMAAALEEGEITPKSTYVDYGYVTIGPDTIYNYDERIYGEVSMTEVLEKSINTGAVYAQDTLSHDTFVGYIEKFGIFEATGVDLEGEVFSRNKEFKEGYEINYATAAFGQGIEMTPLQVARAFCVFANGGKLVKPYFVEKIISPDGVIVETESEIGKESVISSQTASQITAMLVSVVENGFGKRAKVPNYYIAGKTGTAQVTWSALGINQRGYSDKTIQSFIGFAPAFNPEFLIMVKLDNPRTGTAEYSAVPLFQKLAKYIIDYYQIPPDYSD